MNSVRLRNWFSFCLTASLLVNYSLVNSNELPKETGSGKQSGYLKKQSQGDWHEFGRKLYNYRCYYCHGYSGNAKTLAATFMQPAPKDFTSLSYSVSKQYMLDVVKNGKPGTGMVSFTRYLNEQEREAVIDFIRQEFMLNKNINTLYHSEKNGWPDHERYAVAFPFATGDIPLDTPQQQLSDRQLQGYRLFMSSCVSCHDRAKVNDEGAIWQARSVSYPRNNFSYTQIDAISSASIYVKHDIKKQIDNLNPAEKAGETLFQDNCAFCHAADGTGKNWIGSFLDRKPRNLADDVIKDLNMEQFVSIIQEGVPNTSMPAWKNVMNREQIESVIAYIRRAFHSQLLYQPEQEFKQDDDE